MPDPIHDVMSRTDWHLLSQQKLTVLKFLTEISTENALRGHYMSLIPEDENLISLEHHLQGLLNWIDAIQDGAQSAGLPVVWLSE
jgi:hypothetical protein